MQNHSSTLLWVVGAIFSFILIIAVLAPTITTVSTNESNRLTNVTNGADITPPSAWTPGTTTP